MKKIIRFLIISVGIILIINCFWHSELSAQAQTGVKIGEVMEYYDDGTYMTITIMDESPVQSRTSSYVKNGSKAYVLKDSSDRELWRFTVHGTFSVNSGVSATCTAVSHSYNISNSAWRNESASSYSSGNQAIGDATFKKTSALVFSETKSCHVVLTCDSNGNLY